MGYSFHDDDNPIIGRTLSSVVVADDKESILFVLDDDSRWRARVEGDCCSQSWIEYVTVPTSLGVVTAITDSGGDEVADLDHDCLRVYNTAVATDKGEVIVEYRNSSNGYYGGSLRFPVLERG